MADRATARGGVPRPGPPRPRGGFHPMRLLIVEDEQRLAQVLKMGFEEHGFVVELAHDGREGLFFARHYGFDAIVLDIRLPELDGMSLLRWLRRRDVKTPVLMVTAKRELRDRVSGLESGADDYIAKPFEFEELLARVRAAIRRSKDQPDPVIRVADLEIDTNRRRVARAGRLVGLSAKEYDYLEYLALNRGRVVAREELIEHLYDTGYAFDSNIVDVYISNLRRKIDRPYGSKLLQTVRGAGYRLNEDGGG